MIKDYINNHFENKIEHTNFIQDYLIAHKTISISFEVERDMNIDETCEDYNHNMNLASYFTNETIKFYKDKFCFVRPRIIYKNSKGIQSEFTVNLGLIDKDQYKAWKKLNEKKNNN